MGKPGKPHNDGTILTIRVPLGTHAAIARIQGRLVANGKRPAQVTKGRVVEEAVTLLEASLLPADGSSGTEVQTGG